MEFKVPTPLLVSILLSTILVLSDSKNSETKNCDNNANPYSNLIFFADGSRQELYKMDRVTTAYIKIPVKSIGNPITVDIDPVENKLYLTDRTTKRIRRVDFDGQNDTTLWQLGGKSVPDGLCVDYVSRLIFYTDTGEDVITVMTYDGRFSRNVIRSGLKEPRAIVAEYAEGKVWRVTKDGYGYIWLGTPVFTRLNGLRVYKEASSYSGNGRSKFNGGCSHFCFPRPRLETRCQCPDGLRLSSDQKKCLPLQKSVPDGLCVDYVSRLIFYTDTGEDVITVMTYDGRFSRNVIRSGLKEPRAIVAEYAEGVIFWTDWGTPKIEKSNYDGTERKAIVTSYLLWPNGLSIDRKKKHIYWCDGRLSKIERMDYNGGNRVILASREITPLPQYFAIDVDDDYMYTTDMVYNSKVWRVTKDGYGYIWLGTPVFTRLNGLRVYKEASSYSGNGCSKFNGGCSLFCFPRPRLETRCQCPDGLRLSSDQKKCLPLQNGSVNSNTEVLVTDSVKNTIYRLNHETLDYRVIPSLNHLQPTAITLDPVFDRVVWIDKERGRVQGVSLQGENDDGIIISENGSHVFEGLALDYLSRLLFVTESKYDGIIMTAFDDVHFKTIYVVGSESVEDPFAITCDYLNGLLFWTSLGKSPKIQRAKYDGSQVKTLVTKDLALPLGLTIDIKETNGCIENKGGCSHICLPKPKNNRMCMCFEGYYLQANGVDCGEVSTVLVLSDSKNSKTTDCDDDANPYSDLMFFADGSRQELYKMDRVTTAYIKIPVKSIGNPIAVDIDPTENKLYWTDRTTKRICRVDFDGQNDTTLWQLGGKSEPDGLCVDYVSRLIFYTDRGEDVITVMTYDGRFSRNVIHSGLKEPRAIVAEYSEGVIFWTDWGTPKIEKSNYDGTERKAIVSSNLLWPNGLSIDRKKKHIYWCDGGLSKIERMDYNGGNRVTLASRKMTPLPQYFAIDVDDDYMYTTDWVHNSKVWRITKDGYGYIWLGTPVFTRLNGLRVYKEASSYSGNGCSKSNGGCSHFCFPRPRLEARCQCPDGLRLSSDQKKCLPLQNGSVNKNTEVLVTDSVKNTIYRLNHETLDYRVIPSLDHLQPTAITLDPVFDRVVWIDKERASVESVSLQGENDNGIIILEAGSFVFEDLALDYLSRLLFLTESKCDGIIMTAFDDVQFKTIYVVGSESVEDPFAITCDYLNGLLFWTSLGKSPKIQRANYDGSQVKTLVTKDLALPLGLTIDIKGQRLYWSDFSLSTIESVDTSGMNRKLILSEHRRQCLGLSFHEGFIYIADKSRRSIIRMRKDGGAVEEIGLPDLESPLDVHVTSAKPSKDEANGCIENKGNCSHICLPKPKKNRICMCFEGYSLRTDGFECEKDKRSAAPDTDDDDDDDDDDDHDDDSTPSYSIGDITVAAGNLTNF